MILFQKCVWTVDQKVFSHPAEPKMCE